MGDRVGVKRGAGRRSDPQYPKVRSAGAPGAGAALAFVHCLHATGLDLVAFLDELGRAAAAEPASTRTTGRGRRGCSTALCNVKSAGTTSSRLSQGKGNETGTPGRTRGLYAAMTVAPPTRVASTKTFPPRSSFMKAVVAIAGSNFSARAAIARVAAAASSIETLSSMGTKMCRPLAPLVLIAPSKPDVTERVADEPRDADDRRERVAVGRVEVEHEMRHPVGAFDAGERRVVLDRSLVREPDQRAEVVAEGVRDVAVRRFGPDVDGAHP